MSCTVPADLPAGRYALGLAILDPAGMLPSVRFAISNYWDGGRHPLGWIGAGGNVQEASLDEGLFSDPAEDRSPRYELPGANQCPTTWARMGGKSQ